MVRLVGRTRVELGVRRAVDEEAILRGRDVKCLALERLDNQVRVVSCKPRGE